LPEKKFKRYAIKVEDEQDFEKLLANLHERFPNMVISCKMQMEQA